MVSLATIRSMLFMDRSEDEVISSVDVSVAFLQSIAYSPTNAKRYVKYKPHKQAKEEYYELLGPLYGQRSASMSL